MLVIHLDHADKFEIASLNRPIILIIRAHLVETINISFVEHSQSSLIIPGYARANQLNCWQALEVPPSCPDQVIGDVHINVLCFRFANHELFGLKMDVQLVSEVGREDVWHASFACQMFRIPLNVIVGLPLDLLPMIFLTLQIILTIFLVDINSVVNRRDKVVDDFHEFSSVAAKIQLLARG